MIAAPVVGSCGATLAAARSARPYHSSPAARSAAVADSNAERMRRRIAARVAASRGLHEMMPRAARSSAAGDPVNVIEVIMSPDYGENLKRT